MESSYQTLINFVPFAHLSTVKLRVEEQEEAMAEVLNADKENIEMTASHNR